MFRSDRKYMTLVATVGCLAAAGTAFAQMQPATPEQQTRSGYASPATQMPPVIPNKAETASSAFEKLDMSHLGYLTKDRVARLDGFEPVFAQADKDKDGRLTQDEFKLAWALYTGNRG